jgi:hypothetical protein
MIQNCADLKEYLAADLAANYVPKTWFKRKLYALHGNEQCNAFRYIRMLRYTEYFLNTGHRVLYHLCRWRLSRLGLKLFIRISLNTTGKGLCIIHLAGGGGQLFECQIYRR